MRQHLAELDLFGNYLMWAKPQLTMLNMGQLSIIGM